MENSKRLQKRGNRRRARINDKAKKLHRATVTVQSASGRGKASGKARIITLTRAEKAANTFDVEGLIRAIQADTERLGSMPKPQAHKVCNDRLINAGIIDGAGRLTPRYADKKKKKA